MENDEALLAIAQIALGLAGFGGVFVAVGRGRDGVRRPADTYRLVLLLTTALATLLVFFQRWRRRHLVEIRSGEAPLVATAIWVLSAAVLAAQILNAAGRFDARCAGVFLVGLVFLVAFGSYLFARMLFLWKG